MQVLRGDGGETLGAHRGTRRQRARGGQPGWAREAEEEEPRGFADCRADLKPVEVAGVLIPLFTGLTFVGRWRKRFYCCTTYPKELFGE